MTPAQRALLNTISYAEGTWKDGRVQYDMRFGGGRYDNSKPHPDQVIRSGTSSIASAAHGGYQFMPSTWNGANDGRNVAMTPEAQDAAALKLAGWRGYDFNKSFSDQVELLAPEWASFPNAKGVSNYNQPVKSKADLVSFYEKQMESLGGGGGTGLPAAPQGDMIAAKPQTGNQPSTGGFNPFPKPQVTWKGNEKKFTDRLVSMMGQSTQINPLQFIGPVMDMFLED